MSSGRLQQQFIRLWQCCDGKSQETTLNELAEMLSCSRRHMRTLLNMMESRGWLTWEAEAGRGKRSRLTFLYTGLALQQQRAEDLLEQDRIDQLVQLVGDKAAVRQMLVSHLGRSFRQGRHILRVLYYRPMKNLLPGSALRRSETHIARQIFSALTRVNEENGELEADIAHHWQQLTPTHWRFFLRPGIHFHHGRELEMADVIASLQRSNALPLYSHIERIESPTAWTLDIHLRQPDRWLPWLLGQVPAMVLPQEWQTMNHFSSMPVGTGPYAVVRNNQNQLKIHAFEDYFGYRALIDEVNVWVLPEISEEPNGGLTLQGIDDNAMGLGVLLELAEHLKNVPTRYGIRFIATSGEEEGRLGAQNLLQRMSEAEKKNTLLVINLDNLVVGDKLYFNSGRSTPASVRKLTRDRALAIARSKGIAAYTNPGLNPAYPKGTSCCNDASVFDNAGIPVLSVEATNWSLGKKDGYQQRSKSASFPQGTSWHDVQLDNQQYIDHALPGRIEHRGREVVKVMLPLVKELAKVEKPSSLK